MARSRLSRLCLILWLSVIMTDILRGAVDTFEDATTKGLPASLSAAALAVTAWVVIRALAGAAAPPRPRRVLAAAAAGLWMTTAATLALRNTGAHHPADYLLGFIFVEGIAAASATVCLAIRTVADHDKARLVRALAEVTGQSDPTLQRHLVPASSVFPRAGR